MNYGKAPGNVLKRSVINLIGKGPRIGIDVSEHSVGNGVRIISSTQVGVINNPIAATLAVVKACNNISAAGGDMLGVQAAFMLSPKCKERELKRLTRQTMSACRQCNTFLNGGHTEITEAVNYPVSTVTAIGNKSDKVLTVRDIKPGMEIVMTKWAGLEEAAILMNDQEVSAKLRERFSPYYMNTFEHYEDWLSIAPEAEIARDYDNVIMHDNSDGGVFASLWDMAEGAGLGFEVDLRAIPLRQEIIELAYVCNLNIYRMKSSGSLMIVCNNGMQMADRLNSHEIPAVLIGRFTDNNDKIIRNEDEIRYLERV